VRWDMAADSAVSMRKRGKSSKRQGQAQPLSRSRLTAPTYR
jgi:hypothetical protein